jgi:xylose isomerase
MHDPDRVKRGAVHVGALGTQGVPKGDRLNVVDTDGYPCRVRMRLLLPYLIVADNGACGGMNVSFSGVYRRQKAL